MRNTEQMNKELAVNELIKRAVKKFCSTSDQEIQQFLINFLEEQKKQVVANGAAFIKSFFTQNQNIQRIDELLDSIKDISPGEIKDNKSLKIFAVLLKFFDDNKHRNTIPKQVMPSFVHNLVLKFLNQDLAADIFENIDLLSCLQSALFDVEKEAQSKINVVDHQVALSQPPLLSGMQNISASALPGNISPALLFFGKFSKNQIAYADIDEGDSLDDDAEDNKTISSELSCDEHEIRDDGVDHNNAAYFDESDKHRCRFDLLEGVLLPPACPFMKPGQ